MYRKEGLLFGWTIGGSILEEIDGLALEEIFFFLPDLFLLIRKSIGRF
jgi:hypothetical protein